MLWQNLRALTLFVVSLLALAPLRAGALSLIGVKFADEAQVGGAKLTLNGLGVRKKNVVLGITVNVYVAALYLAQKSSSADEILKSPTPKRVSLHFAHNVPRQSLRDAYTESFGKNCPPAPNCEAQRASLVALGALMPDVKDGDVMDFDFAPTGVTVSFKGKVRGEVKDPAYARTLLKAWIGEPPNPELKAGVLATGPGV